jgi:uncharacterized membrane protein (UPF0127 family)
MIHIKQSFVRAFLTSVLLCAPLISQANESAEPQNLPSVLLSAGIHKIRAMVAETPDQRQTGLMHRQAMEVNEGMLFVFESPMRQCFWMKNTLLPLSAAFIGDDGRIVNVVDMAPQSLESHCSEKPVRFVLEMHKGWFSKRGLKPGDRIAGLGAKDVTGR